MHRSSIVIAGLASLPLAALTVLAVPVLHRYEAVEPHMGTLVRVIVHTPDEETARKAFRAAFDRIAALDRTLSDYRADSELNRLTRAPARRAMPVSDDLFAVLEASQALANATGGAFDITLGPVIRLWREARRTGKLPDPGALREAASRGGFHKLRLNSEDRSATLDGTGMSLDVGAIGKGYAASEAIEVLTQLGVESGLVALSGDIAFSGAPPGRGGWRIAVHSGDPATLGVPPTLELTHAAVSTAGSSEQHVDVGGRRYSHVIDPASGMGLVGDLTVTVIARHGLDADGLDTAVSVLGVERGLRLIEARGGAAALVIERTSTGTTAHTSTGFRTLAGRHEGR
jgi:thiamine biosynthesis lipoprotein